jgi:hypothetical protein
MPGVSAACTVSECAQEISSAEGLRSRLVRWWLWQLGNQKFSYAPFLRYMQRPSFTGETTTSRPRAWLGWLDNRPTLGVCSEPGCAAVFEIPPKGPISERCPAHRAERVRSQRRETAAAYYELMRYDHELYEEKLEADRERRARNQQDPTWCERRNAHARRNYHERSKTDAEFVENHRAKTRRNRIRRIRRVTQDSEFADEVLAALQRLSGPEQGDY